MLLLTCVMVLVQGSKVELGKYADWAAVLSAVATAGTFLVAVIALKTAPKWFEQKQSETGFNHVVNIMAEYDQLVLNLKNMHYEIISAKTSNQRHQALTSQISKQLYEALALPSKLSSCKRWNIVYPQELTHSFERLSEYYNQSYGIILFRNMTDDTLPQQMIDVLNKLKATVEKDADFLNQDIKEIVKFPQK